MFMGQSDLENFSTETFLSDDCRLGEVDKDTYLTTKKIVPLENLEGISKSD